MLKIKCKVMLSVVFYFIFKFIIVYANDIKSVHYIRKRYNVEQKGLCDFGKMPVSFNFNELYKKEGYIITSDDKIFYLNICGNAPQCGRNVAVCYKNKINSQDVHNIAPFRLNDISYGIEEIRYKINKKKKAKITFICDRHKNEPNITYEKTSLYHFKFMTPKSCYPKPTRCVISDRTREYTYNIESLNRNENNWLVQNVPKDYKIYLNICGKFNPIPKLNKNSDCFYDGTQICLVYNNGNSKNLGVFSDDMQFKDDILSLSIQGGSSCDDGLNTITTNVNFICSFNESGPVLTSNTKCEYNINWMTSAACPHKLSETHNCNLNPMFGSEKMNLKSESIQLNTSLLSYDVCDPFSCNGDVNTHFCLRNLNTNQEIIIGRSNNDNTNRLISNDGLLTMSYDGDNCITNNRVKNRVNVKFNCDYTKNKNKRADVEMSENGCTTNVIIHTNEACLDQEPVIPEEQCSTFLNKSGILNYYNISGLMLTDRNYEVRDPNDPNLVYILNVCQPILFQPETYTHCDPTAIVCRRNDSVADIYKRSKTLGHYENSKLTVVQNESLLIQYGGSFCPFSKKNLNNFIATIEFICDYEVQNSQPILVSNTDCEYYFKWETHYACPFKNETLHLETEENHTNNNNNTGSKEKSVNETINNNNTESKDKSVNETINNDSILKSSIINRTAPKKDIVIPAIENSESAAEIIVNNKIVTTESPNPKIVPLPTTRTLIVPIDIEVSNTSGLFVKNCTFQDLNMYKLPRNINVTSKTGRLYSLNICNSPKSHDCKLENCLSKLKINVTNKLIEMDFHGKSKCHDGYYNSVIYMKCSEESFQPSILKEEACGVELEWKNSAVCALLQEKPKISPNETDSEKSGHIATILISVFTLLLILCASVFISLYFWRKRQVHNSPSCLRRCDYSRVKDSAKII